MKPAAEWIEAYKTKTGATTQDIADALSISRGSLYRRLIGENDFSLQQAQELASLLNVPIDWLGTSPFDLAKRH